MSGVTTTFAPGSLEAECPGGLDWAWYGLGECIRDTRDKISIAFGVLSIAAWFAFGFPQIVTNCVKKIPDIAVSPYLLGFWLVGDTLNFIGSFLTNQLFLQKVLAGYTVIIDLLLIFQYIFYLTKHKKNVKKYGADYLNKNESNGEVWDAEETASAMQKRKTLATVLLGIVGISAIYGPSFMAPMQISQSSYHGRQLLQATTTSPGSLDGFLTTESEKVGYAIGWIGAVMYFCSRVPQIRTNFKRKSTEGLSPLTFVLAVFGNTFYGLQIFVKSIDLAFVLNALPWILGSLGILIFDAILLVQFFIYRHNTTTAHPGDDVWDEDVESNPDEKNEDVL